MKNLASCPRCAAPVEFRFREPLPTGSCRTCGQRFLGMLALLPMGPRAWLLAPLMLGLYVPLHLLGAWLGLRFAAGRPTGPAAPLMS